MAKIAIIAAVAENRVIGNGNTIPWHCPADLQYFKNTTLGHALLMGRKTYQSLKIKPLPGRRNIVVTHNVNFTAEGCDVAGSIEQGLALAERSEKIFIIGGQSIYQQTLNRADQLYLTYVQAAVAGDCFFPAVVMADWQLQKQRIKKADENNPYGMVFKVFKRHR